MILLALVYFSWWFASFFKMQRLNHASIFFYLTQTWIGLLQTVSNFVKLSLTVDRYLLKLIYSFNLIESLMGIILDENLGVFE